VLVDHDERGAAVAGHVHDLRAVGQLLADVEVAQRVRRALDTPVIPLQTLDLCFRPLAQVGALDACYGYETEAVWLSSNPSTISASRICSYADLTLSLP
jgi:hypothetical protein